MLAIVGNLLRIKDLVKDLEDKSVNSLSGVSNDMKCITESCKFEEELIP